jgi:hypothetical protein
LGLIDFFGAVTEISSRYLWNAAAKPVSSNSRKPGIAFELVTVISSSTFSFLILTVYSMVFLPLRYLPCYWMDLVHIWCPFWATMTIAFSYNGRPD